MLRQETRVAPRQGIEKGHALDERRDVPRFEQDPQIPEASEPMEETSARQKGAAAPLSGYLRRLPLDRDLAESRTVILAQPREELLLPRRDRELQLQPGKLLGESRLAPPALRELRFERSDPGAETPQVGLALGIRRGRRFLRPGRPCRRADPEKDKQGGGDAGARSHLQTIGPGDALPERSARSAAVASVMPGTCEEENGRDAKKTPRTRSGSREQW